MNLICTNPASNLAVTLADCKQQARLDTTADDSLVTGYIYAATNYILNSRNLQLLTATFTATLNEWTDNVITLPIVPVSSITSITYLDTTGTQQTLETDQYLVTNIGNDKSPCIITPLLGEQFPDGTNIVVTFTAGYGASLDNSHKDIWAAILLWVADKWQNRETTGQNDKEIPYGFNELIQFRGITTV